MLWNKFRMFYVLRLLLVHFDSQIISKEMYQLDANNFTMILFS